MKTPAPSSPTTRREFVRHGALAIGTMGFSAKSYAAIAGANERISVAVLGVRNQGTVHLNSFCTLKDSHNVAIRALCDPDEALFPAALKLVAEKSGATPSTHWDLRAVLDDKTVDVVSIVTPNHWHALATVWACQAGKHVYVEKPASHNIWEGRQMVAAARKYNRLMQVGLNNRSAKPVREAMAFLHRGGIGDIYMARALVMVARDSYGVARDGTPPAPFHYDQWLGPAPWRPYSAKRSHYTWHWYWDTGNGDTGNTGPHTLDLARWGLAKNEHPVAAYSTGGLFGFTAHEGKNPGKRVYGDVETYDDDRTTQETPNTQTAAFTYADGKIIELATRGRYTNGEGSGAQPATNFFYGTEGWLELGNRTWRAFRRREKQPFAQSAEPDRDRANHWANYLEALRTGKKEALHCDILDGHLSTSLCHLANISYRVGRSLKFDGAKEKFLGDAEADKHLTRDYRKPFVVPASV
jgi:predicted dehydrogenase